MVNAMGKIYEKKKGILAFLKKSVYIKIKVKYSQSQLAEEGLCEEYL